MIWDMDIINTKDLALDHFMESNSYEIVDTKSHVEVCTDGGKPYVSRIHHNIIFERRPLPYMLNLVLPCSLITFGALLSFCHPPDSGEKVGLGVTVLLSLSVFLIIVSDNLPQTAELPFIGILFLGVFLLSILTLSLHYKSTSDNAREMPRWMQVILFEYVACLLCMSSLVTQENPTRVDLNGFEVKTDEEVSKKINRINIAPHDSQQEKELKHTEKGHVPTEANEDMRVISDFVRTLERRHSTEQKEKIKSMKWKNCALILDRLLFVIFVIFNIGFTLWILHKVAHGDRDAAT